MPETTKVDPNVGEAQLGQPQNRRTDPAEVAMLLDGWMQDDEAEQRETFQFLRRALDEDRPEGYKLFS